MCWVKRVGVWRGVTLATTHFKRRWTMHVGLVGIVFLFSRIDSVFSLTPFRHTLLMPSIATISAGPEPLALVILLALPPLPPVIPVSYITFLFISIFVFQWISVISFLFCGFVFVFVGYGSCVYPSSARYGLFLYGFTLLLILYFY